LATLPLELEVVREGDVGDISLLDKEEFPITREFNRMVAVIVNLTMEFSADRMPQNSAHVG
jgi:hypothetical protein